jgi:pyruvate formate lyase activating enzyme
VSGKVSEAIDRNDAAVTGTVFDIQRFSIHDGPGIRTTVFLKGCPLSCRWCHNPQGMSPGPQLAYRSSRCFGCGECVSLCLHAALSLDGGRAEIDRERCDSCGRCVAACVSGALEIIGRQATPAEVMELVARDQPFYRTSGGGMTVGGGEPLAQLAFTLALLDLAGRLGIHRVVDTSGYADWTDLRRVACACELILYDIKVVDADRHRAMTGVGSELVLDNARRLAAEGVALRLRVPIIPGLTDDEDNLRSIARFARELGGPPVDLLPYHRLTESSYRALGLAYPLEGLPPPTAQAMARLRAIVAGGD